MDENFLISTSKRKIELVANDVDSALKLRPPLVFTLFEQIAEVNANELGFGSKVLFEKGICWVLVQLEVRFNSWPQKGDSIELVTWPSKVKRVFAQRGYCIKDETGDVIIEAMSTWVLMDLATRELMTPGAAGLQMGEVAEQSEIFKIQKLKIKDIDADIDVIIAPKYSDFDVNGHVNNAKYIEWVCDYLPLEKIKNDRIGMLNITYKKEIRGEQKVRLKIKQSKDGFVFIGVSDEDNNIIFFEGFGEYKI